MKKVIKKVFKVIGGMRLEEIMTVIEKFLQE